VEKSPWGLLAASLAGFSSFSVITPLFSRYSATQMILLNKNLFFGRLICLESINSSRLNSKKTLSNTEPELVKSSIGSLLSS